MNDIARYIGLNMSTYLLLPFPLPISTSLYVVPPPSISISTSISLYLILSSSPISKDGLTALLMAAQNGHWEVVTTLLDGGADASVASEVRTLL